MESASMEPLTHPAYPLRTYRTLAAYKAADRYANVTKVVTGLVNCFRTEPDHASAINMIREAAEMRPALAPALALALGGKMVQARRSAAMVVSRWERVASGVVEDPLSFEVL